MDLCLVQSLMKVWTFPVASNSNAAACASAKESKVPTLSFLTSFPDPVLPCTSNRVAPRGVMRGFLTCAFRKATVIRRGFLAGLQPVTRYSSPAARASSRVSYWRTKNFFFNPPPTIQQENSSSPVGLTYFTTLTFFALCSMFFLFSKGGRGGCLGMFSMPAPVLLPSLPPPRVSYLLSISPPKRSIG